MYISSNETSLLHKRFSMMEAYLNRYSLNYNLALTSTVYAGAFYEGEASFNALIVRANARLDKISKIHNRARQLMYDLGFDFDNAEIVVPDSSTENRTVTFSHAQLIVFSYSQKQNKKATNMLIETVSYGTYDNVKICIADLTNSMCQRLVSVTDQASIILFNSMSKHQNYIADNMSAELSHLATKGANVQYIINSVCGGLVLLCLIVIIPVFLFVIKDKSYVLSIFSDIESNEIEEIIRECKKVDIKHLRFKKKWVMKFEHNSKQFWNKVNNSESSECNDQESKKKSTIIKPVNCNPEKKSEDLQENVNEKQQVVNKEAIGIIGDANTKKEKRILLSEIEYFFSIFNIIKKL